MPLLLRKAYPATQPRRDHAAKAFNPSEPRDDKGRWVHTPAYGMEHGPLWEAAGHPHIKFERMDDGAFEFWGQDDDLTGNPLSFDSYEEALAHGERMIPVEATEDSARAAVQAALDHEWQALGPRPEPKSLLHLDEIRSQLQAWDDRAEELREREESIRRQYGLGPLDPSVHNPPVLVPGVGHLHIAKSNDHWKDEARDNIGRWTDGPSSGSAAAGNGAAVAGGDAPTDSGLKDNRPVAPIRQPAKSEDELYAQAHKALDEFLSHLDKGQGIAAKAGAETVDTSKLPKEHVADAINGAIDGDGDKFIVAPIKGRERAREKVDLDYGGDWSRVKDVVRGTYVASSADSARQLAEMAQKHLDVVEVKDRFSKPTEAGYRDMNLSVRLPSGHVAELQVNVRPMLAAKAKAHGLYEEQRSLQGKAEAGHPPSPGDTERLKNLIEAQRRIYHSAWEG